MKIEIGKEYYLTDNSYSQDLSNGQRVTVNNGHGLAGSTSRPPVKVKIITNSFKISLPRLFDSPKITDCRIVEYQNKQYLVMDSFKECEPVDTLHHKILRLKAIKDELIKRYNLTLLYLGDEVKIEPKFKVGDRPKWTEELIKQLPHGTVLKCAVGENSFIWSGQDLIKGYFGLSVIIGHTHEYFYEEGFENYAKIISLPTEESVTNVADKCDKQDFKRGDEVDHKFANTDWLCEDAIFTGGYNSKGNPIVEVYGDLHTVKEIRKPIDKDQEKMEELYNKWAVSPHNIARDIILEAIKYGESKNK